MSRQNKVNPGQYTQRGRLTQDDAAREFARQRSIGPPHTWQPVRKDVMPRLASKEEDADRGAESPDTAKPGSVATPAGKTTAPRTVRTAVLARNTGGGVLKPLRAATRRKS